MLKYFWDNFKTLEGAAPVMKYTTGRCLLSRRLREAGMTQQELADKIPMDKRQISRYVNGDIKGMSLETAVTIANALSCLPEELYEWIPVEKEKEAGR